MFKSFDYSNLQNMKSPFSQVNIRHKSSILPPRHKRHLSERNSQDLSERPERYFRLMNRNSIHNPITGQIIQYPKMRSVSPLGFKNIKVPEKITTSSYEKSEYFFERLTKRNPKVHLLNPITGDHSEHKTNKSFIPYNYQCNFTPESYKPIRYTKGKGYQKSAIY